MEGIHKREYNLVLEVQQPALGTPHSRAIERAVDEFLKKNGAQPVHTVAETIFPAAEYKHGGIKAVYEYPKSIYPHISSAQGNGWGTYAQRLTQRKCSDGSTISPLELVIEKLKANVKKSGPMRAVYELDLGFDAMDLKLYSAEDDHSRIRGGQCMSHISLKLGENHELYLTALYRYQYFVQKALGNLLGLARLQSCIAREVGISTGPLVCHATMAILENRQLDSSAPWSRDAVKELLAQCSQEEPAANAAA